MSHTHVPFASGPFVSATTIATLLLALVAAGPRPAASQTAPFHLLEATIEDIHGAYRAGRLTSRQLVQLYLSRIEAYDERGPNINAIITVNPGALKEAARLDATFKSSGFVGPLHGILRESMGYESEPDSTDFARVTAVFDRAVGELRTAGALLVDPVVIPKLQELLATRASSPAEVEESFKEYFGRSARAPFGSREDMLRSPDFDKVSHISQLRLRAPLDAEKHHRYLVARDALMTNVLKVMADHQLDAIAYKAVEHPPTLIKDGVASPFVNQKGAPALNTFLVFVPAIVVPAGLDSDDLPAGITFMGRPYDDATLIKLAYAYEQATHHRRAPSTTPSLPNEP